MSMTTPDVSPTALSYWLINFLRCVGDAPLGKIVHAAGEGGYLGRLDARNCWTEFARLREAASAVRFLEVPDDGLYILEVDDGERSPTWQLRRADR